MRRELDVEIRSVSLTFTHQENGWCDKYIVMEYLASLKARVPHGDIVLFWTCVLLIERKQRKLTPWR
jgi:hypothetical protein